LEKMNKHWIIATVLLLMAGAVGFVAVVFDIRNQTYRTAIYKARYGKAADLYTQQYLDWNRLSPDVRVENPWGQGQYGGPEIRQQLVMQQPEKLKADLPDLAAGLQVPDVLADTLYGPRWHQSVTAYKKRTDFRNGVMITSTLSFVAGLIISLGYASTVAFRRIRKKAQSIIRRRRQKDADDSDRAPESPTEDTVDKTVSPAGIDADARQDKPDNSVSAAYASEDSDRGGGYFRNLRTDHSVRKTQKLKDDLKSKAPPLVPPDTQAEGSALTESIGKLMSTAPLSTDLSELTKEVSAIREFAAEQQNRVRQLQDGYDWTIIKRFCLRIIRCIDNLDETIQALAEQQQDTQAMEDIRDELTFALESSGVEQFRPDVDCDYKGLEKFVEAIKARVPCDDPELFGKIAAIVRPGYQYCVNENDLKIVRCSQVKLYGQPEHCEVTK
jgi:molecular chaperone GrpE (heat shock protein)